MDSKTTDHYFFLFVNSAVLFISADILTILLRESAHFFMALSLDATEIRMYHNGVDYNSVVMNDLNNLLTHGAGPLMSLLVGIVFQALCLHRMKKDLVFMFMNYMAIFGYISFFGYFIIAPFTLKNSIGYIMHILNVPLWLVFSGTGLSVLFLYTLMFRLTRNFVAMCPFEALEIRYARQRMMLILILYPLIIGIIITTLLNLPAAGHIQWIIALTWPTAILWTFPQAIHKDYVLVISNSDFDSLNRFNVYPLILLIIVVGINRLLAFG